MEVKDGMIEMELIGIVIHIQEIIIVRNMVVDMLIKVLQQIMLV